jgi:hypothetical protein
LKCRSLYIKKAGLILSRINFKQNSVAASANAYLPDIAADGHPRPLLLDEDTNILSIHYFGTSSFCKKKKLFPETLNQC